MSKRKFVLIVFALLISLIQVGCKQEVQPKTSYTITAVYDDVKQTLSCAMSVVYVNEGEALEDDVYFHLYPNAYREGAQFFAISEDMIEDAYPKGKSYGGITIDKVSIQGNSVDFEIGGEDEDVLIVPLKKELAPSQAITIDVDFTVSLACVRHRLGYSDNIACFGNWYPIACVRESDGYDISPYYSNGDPFYSSCSSYAVTLTVPSEYTVASSAMGNRTENGISATYDFHIDNVRDFAFVVGKFSKKSAMADGVEVSYYYTSDTDSDGSLSTAVDALSWFSATFGKYPYKTYSVVQTPFIYGGMEYPGLVYVSDALNRSLSQEAIIHETAHQWWYGLVGNNEVKNAWMDEGLTEYSTTLFYEANGKYNVSYKARMADAMSAYVVYTDVSKADGVMDKCIGDFTSYDYTYLTYLKGAILFDAVRKSVGDKNFFFSLRNYCNEYKYKNATPDGMISSFSLSCHRDLSGLFESFIYGKAKIF